MKFSYNWIKDYLVGKVPSAQEMAELLMFHSFEIEEVVKKGNDHLIDIKVLPNRVCDCSGHLGIAREVAAITKLKIKDEVLKVSEDQKIKTKNLVEVQVGNAKDCLRYNAKVILGVRVGRSPQWLQERLMVCGLKPINNIVDATNYVMLVTGQPLHAFDFDKIRTVAQKKRIVVRRAKKGETITTLDDKAYELNESILVIADDKEPIAVAGIKGGLATGIDDNTKNIIIEAANFYGPLVRKGSQILKLKTDASGRFENWIDPNLVDDAQRRAVNLVQKLAGGKVTAGSTDVYPKKALPKKIILNPDKVRNVLGWPITNQEIKSILHRLGFKCGSTAQSMRIEVPTRRLDVVLVEDLIEEIGRIAGYEAIKPQMPCCYLTVPQKNEDFILEREAKNTFQELGFCETYNYSFLGAEEKEIFGFPVKELLELENPTSQFTQYLRPSLIPNLLKTAKQNLRFFDSLKISEVGKVYQWSSTGAILERKVLSGLFIRDNNNDVFSRAKGVIEELFRKVSVDLVTWQALPDSEGHSIWHLGKSTFIKLGKEKEMVGVLGFVHPVILEKMGIKANVIGFEINLGELKNSVSFARTYEPIAQYPAVERDLSLWVPKIIGVGEVLRLVERETAVLSGKNEKINIALLSVDERVAQEQGKNNIVLRVSYQAKDRSLSSEDVNPKQNKLIEVIEKQEGWEVRK
ncbi:MAG: phenylalanine--tRNA ligase subunit beta [Candidatus Pacebacteria bacterium]|nr:phenylalanine--tRNA ligase subunit beta [Candidatus Paceibacterota bacterium]